MMKSRLGRCVQLGMFAAIGFALAWPPDMAFGQSSFHSGRQCRVQVGSGQAFCRLPRAQRLNSPCTCPVRSGRVVR